MWFDLAALARTFLSNLQKCWKRYCGVTIARRKYSCSCIYRYDRTMEQLLEIRKKEKNLELVRSYSFFHFYFNECTNWLSLRRTSRNDLLNMFTEILINATYAIFTRGYDEPEQKTNSRILRYPARVPFPPLLTSFPLYLVYRNPSTLLSTTAFVWQRKRAVSPRKNKRTKRSIIENQKQSKFLFGKSPSHSLLASRTERKVHRRITSNVCALPCPRRVQQFDFWCSSGFPNKFPTLVEDKSSLNNEWVYVTIKSTCRVTVAEARKKQVCYRLFG